MVGHDNDAVFLAVRGAQHSYRSPRFPIFHPTNITLPPAKVRGFVLSRGCPHKLRDPIAMVGTPWIRPRLPNWGKGREERVFFSLYTQKKS